MRATKATIAGFKGEYTNVELGKVSLISGRNRSGKTAIVSGIQAALCGNIDQIGSANAKIVLLADKDSKKAESTVELEDNWRATYSIKQGRNASATRKIMKDGMELDVEAAQKILLGDVPCTPSKLWSMSGEEMWSLMIRHSEAESGLIETIKRTIGGCQMPQVSEALTCCVEAIEKGDSTSAIGYARDAISCVNKSIKEAELAMQAEVPVYDGPPEADLHNQIHAVTSIIQSHTANKNKAELISRDIQRLEKQIEQSRAKADANARQLESTKTRVQNMEACLSIIDRIANAPEINADATMVTGNCEQALAHLRWLSKVTGEDMKEVDHFIDACMFWADAKIKENTNSLRMTLANQLVSMLNECLMTGYSGLAIAANPSTIRSALENRITLCTQEIANLELAIKNSSDQCTIIDTKRNDFLAMQGSILSQEAFEKTVATLEQLNIHKAVLDSIEAASIRGEQMAKRIAEFTAVKDTLETIFSEIQAWRKEMVDDTMQNIQDSANVILDFLEMPSLAITLISGKRSSVTLEAGGVNVLAMSGAERTIYSTALLYSIQEFHGVTLPIIFIEGGELDQTTLDKLIEIMDKTPRCNAIIAHYLSSNYESPTFKNIEVNNVVAA